MQIVEKYKNENTGKVVEIVKIIKEGTKRVFFYPRTIEGKRISRTNFARKYDAVRLGKVYADN
jgi:hypothetical protein